MILIQVLAVYRFFFEKEKNSGSKLIFPATNVFRNSRNISDDLQLLCFQSSLFCWNRNRVRTNLQWEMVDSSEEAMLEQHFYQICFSYTFFLKNLLVKLPQHHAKLIELGTSRCCTSDTKWLSTDLSILKYQFLNTLKLLSFSSTKLFYELSSRLWFLTDILLSGTKICLAEDWVEMTHCSKNG